MASDAARRRIYAGTRHPTADGGSESRAVFYRTMNVERFTGCLLGLAYGDALGAPHEGGVVERAVWRFLGTTKDGCARWTDDTQMAIDLGESLLSEGGVCPAALAARFAASYRWSRGYGPGTARILKRIRRGQPWETACTAVYPQGSYGNGAAMRAPAVALYYAEDRDEMLEAAAASARVTHAHPLGIEGAVAMAAAARSLLLGQSAESTGKPVAPETIREVLDVSRSAEFQAKVRAVASLLDGGKAVSARQAVIALGNASTAVASCPTALYIALRYMHDEFEELMRFTIACRGDVDTIGAMAGALWGAANGEDRLPRAPLEAREQIADLARRLFRASRQRVE
jgi:poly(ADP-ribose) glycohydrolase ARH3